MSKSDRPQTLSVSCGYCSWTAHGHAPSEHAALGAGQQLRAQLIEHCERAHPEQLAGPPPADAPAPPPPPDPATLDQLQTCLEALHRIQSQHTLTAAKQLAADALAGIRPRQAWNRSTRVPRGRKA